MKQTTTTTKHANSIQSISNNAVFIVVVVVIVIVIRHKQCKERQEQHKHGRVRSEVGSICNGEWHYAWYW
jgi:hypothetical protein